MLEYNVNYPESEEMLACRQEADEKIAEVDKRVRAYNDAHSASDVKKMATELANLDCACKEYAKLAQKWWLLAFRGTEIPLLECVKKHTFTTLTYKVKALTGKAQTGEKAIKFDPLLISEVLEIPGLNKAMVNVLKLVQLKVDKDLGHAEKNRIDLARDYAIRNYNDESSISVNAIEKALQHLYDVGFGGEFQARKRNVNHICEYLKCAITKENALGGIKSAPMKSMLNTMTNLLHSAAVDKDFEFVPMKAETFNKVETPTTEEKPAEEKPTEEKAAEVTKPTTEEKPKTTKGGVTKSKREKAKASA